MTRQPVPVEIGCGNCGHRYVVTDVDELHTELDAAVWHERCGTAVACPAVADVVRCTQRGPDVTALHGCGDLIPGPAAGGPPPPAGADRAEQSVPAPWRIDRPTSLRPADPWAAVTGETTTRHAKRP